MDLPGVVRNYAKIDGPFSAEAWFTAFRRGHMYVSNGPLLEFSVNKQPMGAEVKVARGAILDVVAEADLNPDIDALSGTSRSVAHGEVIATEQANGQSRVSLRASVLADRSKWLAVRAWGRRQERSNMTVALLPRPSTSWSTASRPGSRRRSTRLSPSRRRASPF